MSSAEIRPIDVRHLGRPRVICSWLVGDVLVDPGPASALDALLEGLGGFEPRAIALTHIHLDHAGATGTLAQRWPDAEVWVHERGARHMIDPARLIESATRLYGADMDRLWGEFLPVPEDRVRVLHGGEELDPFEVAYTPGHASHHVSYGIRVGHRVCRRRRRGADRAARLRAAADAAARHRHRSLARLDRDGSRLAAEAARAHALRSRNRPGAHLDQLDRQLDRWAARARETDRDEFAAELRADVIAACGPEDAACYQQGAPYEHIYDGLARYWSKRDAAAGTA